MTACDYMIEVWDMDKEMFVDFKKWMIWCPSIVTKHIKWTVK